MISDAYEAFQADYAEEADDFLGSWHAINVLESDVSLSQRSVTFRKIGDQFQKLVRIWLKCRFSGLSYVLGK